MKTICVKIIIMLVDIKRHLFHGIIEHVYKLYFHIMLRNSTSHKHVWSVLIYFQENNKFYLIFFKKR